MFVYPVDILFYFFSCSTPNALSLWLYMLVDIFSGTRCISLVNIPLPYIEIRLKEHLIFSLNVSIRRATI